MSGTSVTPPPIDSRIGFMAALDWGFQQAVARDARRIVCVDPDWADWPWDDVALLERLVAWLKRPQRRLVLIARRYDDVPRRSPRFTAWRRDWVHAIEAWSPSEGYAGELPTLVLDDRATVVHLVDRRHWRGEALVDERTAGLWRERTDAVLQRSEPAFSASQLGL